MRSDQIEEALGRVEGGFRREPLLQPISDSLAKKDLAAALAAADLVLQRASENFATPAHERLIKAEAHRLRGEALSPLGRIEEMLEALRAAADLGSTEAAYQLGAQLLIQADLRRRQGGDPATVGALLEEAARYHRMAAELGIPEAIDILSQTLKLQGQELEQHYWSLLLRMAAPAEQMTAVAETFQSGLDATERAYFAQAVTAFGLSGRASGARGSGIGIPSRLPGRSTLTAAYVDFILRRQLAFTWRAFFSDAGAGANQSLLMSYEALRAVLHRPPIAELYLLVGDPIQVDSPRITSVNRRSLLAHVLPGDVIVVEADGRQHIATLWALDSDVNTAWILDPFPEFWQPSHNSEVTHYCFEPYRYERSLVCLALHELGAMLIAAMTIRDAAAA